MPYFGTFRGFNNNLFGDKLFAGQKPIFLGDADNFFGFTINTNNTSAGSSTNTQFTLPLTTSQDLDFVIDWGDGVVERITSHTALEITHTYGTAGIYEIQIRGSILGWRFGQSGDRLKMLNIFQWGVLNISTDGGFFGCENLTCSATDAPIITGTSLVGCFQNCNNFNGAIGNWNTGNVTNMSAMFRGAAAFNQNIGSWNTGNVTNMSFMFLATPSFNQNIGNWNTGNVTNMESMFNGATAFNQNIGAWNVSKVTNFISMFNNATAFNNGGSDDIDNWVFSTTSDINMSQMFGGSNTTLSCKFNRYIGSWDTQRVTNMSSMFLRNTAFNQDIGSWNTSNVTNMSTMFNNATAFNQDISDWNIANVTNFGSFMLGKTNLNYSATNLDLIYNKWSLQSVKPNISISFGTIKYTASGQAGKDILTGAPNNWTITDGGT